MIPDLTGIVLAGGKSSRFGANKALAPWRGAALVSGVVESLLGVLPRVLVVAKERTELMFLEKESVRVETDLYLEGHPLGGIRTGLEAIETRRAFVCACDMPLVAPNLISELWEARSGYDAVIPVWEGKRQPLCGIYSKICSGVIRTAIEDGQLEIGRLFDVVNTRFFLEEEIRAVDPVGRSFQDIDTREDFERIRGLAP